MEPKFSRNRLILVIKVIKVKVGKRHDPITKLTGKFLITSLNQLNNVRNPS